jgi:glycosyltransferase involved in cell wall biosynthesis
MRAGRAAVATRVGGNGEAIAEGASGLLVPVDDVASFADALGALLDDAARREAMGRAARERFLAHFTAGRMVAETEALYRRALGGPVEEALGAAGEGRHATA